MKVHIHAWTGRGGLKPAVTSCVRGGHRWLTILKPNYVGDNDEVTLFFDASDEVIDQIVDALTELKGGA